MKELSIIIPAYNYGHLLAQAVTSVIEQLTDNDELIIVDDGSTDDTEDVVAELKKDNPENIRSYRQVNKGAAAARNAGIELSTGEFLLFLDADDELLPGALDTVRLIRNLYPEVDLFLAGHISVDDSGQLREHRVSSVFPEKEKNFIAYIHKKLTMSHGAFSVRKEQFESISYPEELKNSEDIPVFGQLLASSLVKVIEKPLVKVYKHNDSLRHQIDDNNTGAMEVVEFLFNAKVIGPELLQYKPYYAARRALSLSRASYLAKQYVDSRKWYIKAISYDPRVLFKLSYFRKFIKSFLKRGKSL